MSRAAESVPEDWRPHLREVLESPEHNALLSFVAAERARGPVYPPDGEVYTALRATPYDAVKVLLLGQDPYHGPGQAHGLAFSVRPGVALPPSLGNMFKELQTDLGLPRPSSGALLPWAEQGVLLLNAVLTVRQGEANSHANQGWERFTDAVIQAVGHEDEPVVFLLWGRYAQKKKPLIDTRRHVVLEGVHPSPLSAKKGFFASRPFTRTNEALRAKGRPEVNWSLP